MPIPSQLLPELSDIGAGTSTLPNSVDFQDVILENSTVGKMFKYVGLASAVANSTDKMGFILDAVVSNNIKAKQESMRPEQDMEAQAGIEDAAMDVDLGTNTALASVLASASTSVTEGTESHYKRYVTFNLYALLFADLPMKNCSKCIAEASIAMMYMCEMWLDKEPAKRENREALIKMQEINKQTLDSWESIGESTQIAP
ncbi:hypothetical protein Moror_13437 [Moniliophthora roreri MCA 2997]|uniref:Uncharacterized protein n=1 Tax=Moniliophthora roreri (strain MCA 2997) TaxID=1381753 RepID=V2WP79_MONRO|nr:hypothetical protein Moror_13437 [Moniliophthora roreri MCA 2997]